MKLLAINTGINDSLEKVTHYQQKYGLSYPLIFDKTSEITQLYDVMGTPTQLIVDINGIVRYLSSRVPENLEQHMDALLTNS